MIIRFSRLDEADAEQLGVSRLHTSIEYVAKTTVLQIHGLSSVNETSINRQILYPKEVRVLRNGDEITLGWFVPRADFHTSATKFYRHAADLS